MKSCNWRSAAVLFLCAVGLIITAMGCTYFDDVSNRFYEDDSRLILLLIVPAAVWGLYHYRRKTQKSVMEVRYREMMFDALSNNVDDIFLMLDSKTWKVDYLSPNIGRLLGIAQKDAAGNIRLLAGSLADEHAFFCKEEIAAIPIQGSRYWEREHIHQNTGDRRWYRETVYHESVHGVEKFLIVMSDRTQERQMRRNLEEALASAKSANEAKSHFLSNMSHDIRTPMNAIIGFSALLEKHANDEERVREYTRKISASSQHLLGLINDILDMSKIESGKTSLNVTSFCLPELMEELHTILLPQAKAKGQILQFHAKDRPVEYLMGDKLRLNQILINLLSNAVKYTQEGGTIDFTVQELAAKSSKYAKLRFVVADNGMGMSEEFLQTIFDPFAREGTSANNGIQGTGLGMTITKNLVELMGGVIHVESRLGEGSVFTVELSFALPAASDTEDFWMRHAVSRVLVADDEIEICQDIQEMMRDTGVDVTYVTGGAEAVEAVVSAQEQEDGFDVILLDWKMPGKSGVETVREIRVQMRERIPILVLTSYDWSEIEDEARIAGVDAFMPKPFFVSSFQQALEALYAKRGSEVIRPAEQEENILDDMVFLVAEDNDLNAEIILEVLAMEGARCELAVNGAEAVDMFRRSEPGHYDMVLMDVQMPVMDGYEATRRIRACGHPQAGRIPIVAMTANAFAEDVRNALDSGMNGHLAKPIDLNAVKTLLGQFRKPSEEEHI